MTKKDTKGKSQKASNYKWDVVAAEKEYIENHTLSYQDIAQKYGVDKRTVSRYAQQHDWTARRQDAINSGLEKHKTEHAELISQTNERHLKLWRSAQNGAAAAVKRAHDTKDTKNLASAVFSLKQSIEGERTVLGMPTLIRKDADDDDEALLPANFIDAAKAAEEMLREAGELED